MIKGVLAFFIQWLALSHWGYIVSPPQAPMSMGGYSFPQSHGEGYSYPSDIQPYPQQSHWALLSQFQSLSEEEMQLFLPQICNLVLDRVAVNDPALFDYFEQTLVNKCADCLPFGAKLCNTLKAMASSPREGLFKSMLSSSAQARRDEALSRLQERVEIATMQGRNLPTHITILRAEYYNDLQFLLDTLARLGLELRSFPVHQRIFHLRRALSEVNQLLYYRMMTQQAFSSLHTYNYQSPLHRDGGPQGGDSLYESSSSSSPPFSRASSTYYPRELFGNIDSRDVAAQCPRAASFSLHLPLMHPHKNIYRLLRFVEEKGELLQSKDKTPYLVTVELLEETNCVQSHALYCQGRGLNLHDRACVMDSTAVFGRIMGRDPRDLPEEYEDETGEDDNENVRLFARKEATHEQTQKLFQVEPSVENEDMGTSISSHHPTAPLDSSQRHAPRFFRLSTRSRPFAGQPSHSAQTHDSTQERRVGNEEREVGEGEPNLGKGSRERKQAASAAGAEGSNHDQLSRLDVRGGQAVSTPLADEPRPFPLRERKERIRRRRPARQALRRPHPSTPLGSDDFSPSLFPSYPAPSAAQLVSHEILPRRLPSWKERMQAIQHSSPFGHLPGYTIKSFIVKSGDDLNKEVLALQLIHYMTQVFLDEHVDIFLRSYEILPTGYQCGLIEFLEGSTSIDQIKKSFPRPEVSLRDFFRVNFGESYGLAHQKAINNFIKSLVGYSLLTYVVQVKDRHNANILFDHEGHIVHIDFGFILGDSPGFNINFESAPFKLTSEYIDLLGGLDSANMRMFEDLFVRGFVALQKHIDGLCAIVELFYGDKRKNAVDSLRARLLFPRTHADIIALIGDSLDNWRTKQYDWFQHQSNNIQM